MPLQNRDRELRRRRDCDSAWVDDYPPFLGKAPKLEFCVAALNGVGYFQTRMKIVLEHWAPIVLYRAS